MDHDHNEEIPRVPLIMMAAIALLAFVLAAATSAGWLAREAVPSEERAAAGVVAKTERSLYFFDEAGGTVRIEDAASGETITRIEPGTGGFIRTTMRGLVHVRRTKGIGADTPFVLTEWENGALSLTDTETGKSIELGSFGPDNRAAFAALLDGGQA